MLVEVRAGPAGPDEPCGALGSVVLRAATSSWALVSVFGQLVRAIGVCSWISRLFCSLNGGVIASLEVCRFAASDEHLPRRSTASSARALSHARPKDARASRSQCSPSASLRTPVDVRPIGRHEPASREIETGTEVRASGLADRRGVHNPTAALCLSPCRRDISRRGDSPVTVRPSKRSAVACGLCVRS
jgi:hypothetical protein